MSLTELFLDSPHPVLHPHTPAFAFLEPTFEPLAVQSPARLCVVRPGMDENPRPKRTRSRSPKSAGVRPKFRCHLCPSTFSRKDNLKTHQRLHSGEMPFQCVYCARKFRWQSSARTHEQVHERHGHTPRPELLKNRNNPPASNSSRSPSSTVKVENIIPISAATSTPALSLQPLYSAPSTAGSIQPLHAMPSTRGSVEPLHVMPSTAGPSQSLHVTESTRGSIQSIHPAPSAGAANQPPVDAFQTPPLPPSHVAVAALEPFQPSTLQPPQPPITSFPTTSYLPSSTAPLYSASPSLPYSAPSTNPLPFAPTSTGPPTYRQIPSFSSPLYSNPPPQNLFTQPAGPSRTYDAHNFVPPRNMYSQEQPQTYTSVSSQANPQHSTLPGPYPSAAAESTASAGNIPSRVVPPMGNSPRARRQMRPGPTERGIERVIRKSGRTQAGGLLLDLDDLGGIGEVGVALATQQEPNAQTPQQQHGESPMFKFPNMSQHDIEKCFDPHQHQDEQQQ